MDPPVLGKHEVKNNICRILTGSAQHTLQLSFHVNFANLCTHEILTEPSTLFTRGQCQVVGESSKQHFMRNVQKSHMLANIYMYQVPPKDLHTKLITNLNLKIERYNPQN